MHLSGYKVNWAVADNGAAWGFGYGWVCGAEDNLFPCPTLHITRDLERKVKAVALSVKGRW
jgi:hypothetical protein